MDHPLSEKVIDEGLSYRKFRQRVEELYEQGLPTSGDPNSDIPLLGFTSLNIKRMDRLEKTFELNHVLQEKLLDLPELVYWVVLAEGWCGDVAQNLPAIAKMAGITQKIDLRILWRDEHPEIMDQYLTNGGRSIPKLIALREDGSEVLGTWGPRPEPVQKMILEFKEAQPEGKPKKEMVDELHRKMHTWYARDKSQTLQKEFITLVENWNQLLLEEEARQ